MKKLEFLIIALFVLTLSVNAQTLIKAPTTVAYAHADTVKKNTTFSKTYFVQNTRDILRLQVNVDTLKAGYLKVQSIISGSLDHKNWTDIDTLVVKSEGAKHFGVKLSQNAYYNYLRVTVKAIDSTQFVRVKYYLLIDKN